MLAPARAKNAVSEIAERAVRTTGLRVAPRATRRPIGEIGPRVPRLIYGVAAALILRALPWRRHGPAPQPELDVARGRWIPLLIGGGLLVTLAEIAEQHYYRARFSHRPMYIPLVVTPVAIVAAFARALAPVGPVRWAFRNACGATAGVGLLGLAFHWRGNLRKYRQKEEEGQLPGMGATEEDRKHGPPVPRVEVAGYDLGALLEVGARGRPWLAPLALVGLGVLGVVVERECD